MTESVKPPVVYRVHNYVDGEQVKRDLSYSLANLSDAMMQQPAFLEHYTRIAAQASKQVDDCKLALEIGEAKVYRNLRDKAVKDGEKVTEPMLEKAVAIHDTIIAIKRGLNEAKQVEKMAKAAVEAFNDRKDMLVQLSAGERKEREGEIRIMSSEAREAVLAGAKERFLGSIKGRIMKAFFTLIGLAFYMAIGATFHWVFLGPAYHPGIFWVWMMLWPAFVFGGMFVICIALFLAVTILLWIYDRILNLSFVRDRRIKRNIRLRSAGIRA